MSARSFITPIHLIAVVFEIFVVAMLSASAQKSTLNSQAVQPKPVPNRYSERGERRRLHTAQRTLRHRQTLEVLRLHYKTLGPPHRNAAGHIDNAVLILHGTGGSSGSMLAGAFSIPLFGFHDPLDITRYFLVFPDDIGHGKSSKPSDGMHAHFPHYDYDDMVQSQHRMLTEGLGIDHLRLILGVSMGGMQAFVWGETFPGFADALMRSRVYPCRSQGETA